MRASALAVVGLLAIVTALGTAQAARPEVEALLDAVQVAAETLLYDTAGQGQAVLGDAAGLADGAVQDGAIAAQQLVTQGTDDANAAVAQAAADAYALALQAYHAPDPAIAEAQRKYDDAELLPPLLGDYAQRRLSEIPELTTPAVTGAVDTYLPFVEAAGAGLVVTVGVSGPIGEVPDIILDVADPTTTFPDPANLVPQTQAYLEATVPLTTAWTQEAVQDTLATADAAVFIITR